MKARAYLSLTRIASTLAMASMFLLLLAFTGCGGGNASTGPGDPPSLSIAATPASIASGSSSTLTVSASGATQLTLTGSDGSSYTMGASGGTQAVSPKATTTYTASATGAGGSVSSTATVTVAAVPTVTISAGPASITAGSSSTLTVAATNATAVTVTGTDGSTYTLAAAGGTQAVSPAATTTYTATATGGGSSVTATAVVTVTPAGPAPMVTLSANPTAVVAGGSSMLTATAANATSVVITGSDNSSYTLAATGGMQAVSPSASTTYTATATGPGGTAAASAVVTVTQKVTTVTITANPTSISVGSSSTLTVTAANATAVTVTGSDDSSYTLSTTGGKQSVTPTTNTTYTAVATGASGDVSATVTVSVNPGAQAINHVVFMLQENHTFDNYFGMLNPYRVKKGWTQGDDGNTYTVDGIDDKLTKISDQNDEGENFPLFKFTSTCIDDATSAWLESFGDVNRYNFSLSRPIQVDGFVHDAEGFAKSCSLSMECKGNYTDLIGQRVMGYYDDEFLNYYYYMAGQFAVSDRWFSPIASKSTPNRIATFTGGTTQGLVFDPGSDDHVGALNIPTIFQELDAAGVSWKLYYTVTVASCSSGDECSPGLGNFPSTTLGYIVWARKYLYENPGKAPCTGTTQPSSVVGDSANSFCIDPNHISPLINYYSDLNSGNMASFSFIESGDINDEHPGSGESVLYGQSEVAKIVNAFMGSQIWNDSAFFFSYDEGGGPYDHVPPVPGHTNDKSDPAFANTIDISSISVNPDKFLPCVPAGGTATAHCDLHDDSPGANSSDAAAKKGFAAQLGFRLPNIVISPFTRRHYVSHIPMDHTAVIKFVENRFIGPSAHLTQRDAVQPDLLDFFDFSNIPWATPPTPPAPVTATSLGYDPCTPMSLGPP